MNVRQPESSSRCLHQRWAVQIYSVACTASKCSCGVGKKCRKPCAQLVNLHGSTVGGNCSRVGVKKSEQCFLVTADANARRNSDLANLLQMRHNPHTVPCAGAIVVVEVEPKGTRKIGWSGKQTFLPSGTASPSLHVRNAGQWFCSTQQYGRSFSGKSCYDIDATVHTVDAVHVQATTCFKHGAVPMRLPTPRMACRIIG